MPKHETCENCYHYHMCDLQNRLEDYQDCNHFKDKSLIVELPCKAGDTVYYIGNLSGILTLKVVSVHLSDEGTIRKKKHKSHFVAIEKNSKITGRYNLDIMGNLAFLSYEEAEKALRERDNHD